MFESGNRLNLGGKALGLSLRYKIPEDIFCLLMKWQNPYNSKEIIAIISDRLQLPSDINPNIISQQKYVIIQNIKLFINSTDFVHKAKFYKKSYLTYFFANELSYVGFSKEFHQLNNSLDVLLNTLSSKIKSYNNLSNEEMDNKFIAMELIYKYFNFISFNCSKFFIISQLALYLFQGVYGQANFDLKKINHSNIFDNQTNSLINNQSIFDMEINDYMAKPEIKYEHLNEEGELWQSQEYQVVNEGIDDKSNYLAKTSTNMPRVVDSNNGFVKKSLQQHIGRIKDLIELGDGSMALDVVENGLVYFPESLQLLIHKANILLDVKKFELALKLASQIKSINKDHPELYFIYGAIYLEHEVNYQLALKYFTKAFDLESSNNKYKLFMKTAEYFINPQNTLEFYLNSNFSPLELSAKKFIPNDKLFCMADENNFIANSCRAEFNKTEVNKIFNKADNYHKNNELINALKYYDKILTIIPLNDPYYNLQLQYLYLQKGIIHFSLEQYQEAKKAIGLVIAICTKPSKLAEIYFEYGNTIINLVNFDNELSHEGMKYFEEAFLAYQKAYELKPNDKVITEMYGEVKSLYEGIKINEDKNIYNF